MSPTQVSMAHKRGQEGKNCSQFFFTSKAGNDTFFFRALNWMLVAFPTGPETASDRMNPKGILKLQRLQSPALAVCFSNGELST